MGHHHRRNRNQDQSNNDVSQNTNNNPLGNMDFSSMFGNLNLDNVDLSKIDMNKVQSMMDKISIPQSTPETAPSGSSSNGMDARINFLNSLKAMLPSKRAKSMDSITKFLQVAQLLGPNMGSLGKMLKRK